jgi:hypothetical protein
MTGTAFSRYECGGTQGEAAARFLPAPARMTTQEGAALLSFALRSLCDEVGTTAGCET